MNCKALILLSAVSLFLFSATLSNSNPNPGQKRVVTIGELTATTSEKYLILFATLENSFTSEMIEILQSGIPLHFTFYIELNKITEKLPDEQITALTLQHTMTFDTLKESYKVTIEEEKNKNYSFRYLLEAQRMINEINGAKVIELSQLIPENIYKLKVRAELYRKTLPMSLHNVLPFFSWGDVKTEWHAIEFKY